MKKKKTEEEIRSGPEYTRTTFGKVDSTLHDYYFLVPNGETQAERGRLLVAWLVDAWEHDEDLLEVVKRELEKHEAEFGE